MKRSSAGQPPYHPRRMVKLLLYGYATRVERMERPLRTKAGAKICAQRKGILDPIFGQIKQARRIRQFLLRGLKQVRREWALVCLRHNILKMYGLCAGS